MKTRFSLYDFSKIVVNIFIFLLFSLAIVSAFFMFANILLSSGSQSFLGIIFLLFILLIIFFFKKNCSLNINKLSYNPKIVIIVFLLLFLVQVVMFSSISNNILFDAGSIYNGFFSTDKTDVTNYLSQWQNNFPLYVYENLIKNLFNLKTITKQSHILYTIVNIINYDLGFIFIYLMVKKKYDSKIDIYSLFTCFLVLGLNNQMYQFYTTALSWPATCFGLYLYVQIKDNSSWKACSFFSFIFGLTLAWGYFARPSSIIYFIAIIIFEILHLKDNKLSFPRHVGIAVFLLCGFLSFCITFQFVSKPYELPLNENKNAVMTQYLAYGITGTGAGTPEVRTAIENASSKEVRNEVALSIWKSELKKMGPSGYSRFLLKKHMEETKDGTYGLKNPHIEEHYSSNPLILFLQNIWYSNGKYVNITAILMQFIYLLLLFGVLLSIRSNNNLSFILKLSLLGWHMFLLIFEGARTGYTIQAFPVMIPLAILGFMSLRKQNTSPFYEKYLILN